MTRSPWFVILVLSGAAVVGCGASDRPDRVPMNMGGGGGAGGGGGGTSTPVALTELANALSNALCGNLGSCCARAGYPFEADACNAYGAQLASAYAALDAAKVEYDPMAAGACVAEITQAVKTCVVAEANSILGGDCSRMFVGKVPQGEPCAGSVECAPVAGAEVTCPPGSNDEPETCGLEPARAVAGAACAATRAWSGATCNAGSSGAGSAATQPGVCYASDGLECESPAGGGQACAPLPTLGHACACACAQGAYCDLTTGKCVEQMGTGPCDPTVADACLSTAYCDEASAHCLAKSADGEPCSDPGACVNGGCYRGVCGPVLVATESLCQKGP